MSRLKQYGLRPINTNSFGWRVRLGSKDVGPVRHTYLEAIYDLPAQADANVDNGFLSTLEPWVVSKVLDYE